MFLLLVYAFGCFRLPGETFIDLVYQHLLRQGDVRLSGDAGIHYAQSTLHVAGDDGGFHQRGVVVVAL